MRGDLAVSARASVSLRPSLRDLHPLLTPSLSPPHPIPTLPISIAFDSPLTYRAKTPSCQQSSAMAVDRCKIEFRHPFAGLHVVHLTIDN